MSLVQRSLIFSVFFFQHVDWFLVLYDSVLLGLFEQDTMLERSRIQPQTKSRPTIPIMAVLSTIRAERKIDSL